jgi:hypothetical protein
MGKAGLLGGLFILWIRHWNRWDRKKKKIFFFYLMGKKVFSASRAILPQLGDKDRFSHHPPLLFKRVEISPEISNHFVSPPPPPGLPHVSGSNLHCFEVKSGSLISSPNKYTRVLVSQNISFLKSFLINFFILQDSHMPQYGKRTLSASVTNKWKTAAGSSQKLPAKSHFSLFRKVARIIF